MSHSRIAPRDDDRMPSVSISRSTALLAAVAVLLVLVLGGHWLARTGTASEQQVFAPLAPTAPAPAAAKPLLVVDVAGAVRRPGLYRLPDGARIADAVARAGGATRHADLAAVNLAAPLVDGVQVLVPRVAASGVTATAGGAASSSASAGGIGPKTSLSSATATELDQLPGVGPVTAQKIIDYRTQHGPFRSVDDLDAVPGIGPARIEQLRDLVTP
jgi:competence protein ComEA